MGDRLSLFLSFGAGLVSFLSPCVFPLIPSYLGLLSSQAGARRRALLGNTFLFTLGFSAVFVILSLLFSGAVFLAGNFVRILNIAAGLVVILLGLQLLLGIFPVLENVRRFSFPTKWSAGPASPDTGGGLRSLAMGLAFAAGWTPCVGPILASLLLLASREGARAAVYLAAYAAGLALPFWGAALFLTPFLKLSRRISVHLRTIQTAGAVMIILLGILMLTGSLGLVNSRFAAAGRALLAAGENHPRLKFIPGAIFFLLGLANLLFPLFRRRPLPPARLVFSILLGALGLAFVLGWIKGSALLGRWLLFQGI
jgi:cytochrome c-type biogenesis protein